MSTDSAMQQPLLSIVIPTYNRNHAVVENVRRILPQLQSAVELVVLDNCSTIPVRDSIRDAFGESVFDKLSVVRNVSNLSLVGNSLRVFEVGIAPFIWTLCDDDVIEPDGISAVLDAVASHNDSVFLWFPVLGGPSHRHPGLYRGLLAAIKAEPNSFYNPLSSCVFNRKFSLERLKFGYLYSYSWIPFMCPLFSDIDNTDNLVFISDKPVAVATKTDANDNWSKLDVCLGLLTVLELPISKEARKYLRMSIYAASFSSSRLFLDSFSINDESRWVLFRTFIQRRYAPFSVSVGFWLMLALIGEYAPSLMRVSVRILEHLVGRSLLIEVEDRFARS